MKPGGVSQYFHPDGTMVEVGTSTCAHCQHITDISDIRRMTDYVDFCRNCMRPICLECYGKPCTPAVKVIEAFEQRNYNREQLRKALGLEE